MGGANVAAATIKSAPPRLRELRSVCLNNILVRGELGLKILRDTEPIIMADLAPTGDQALSMLSKWGEECRSGYPDKMRPGETYGLKKFGLSEDSYKRQRYRGGILERLAKWPTDVGISMTLYLKAIEPAVRGRILSALEQVGMLEWTDRDSILLALNDLSVIAKKCREMLFDGEWMKWVDMQTLADYKPLLGDIVFEDDIVDWITGTAVHTLFDSEELFLILFEAGCKEFLISAPAAQNRARMRVITIDLFCADPAYWQVGGSSSGKKLTLMYKGKVVGAKRTKNATAMAMSESEVRSMLLGKEKQENMAIQKREKAKVRAVIAGGLRLYLQMSFVSATLEQLLAGHPNTTLFMNIKQVADLWIRMGEDTLEGRSVCMPIDQSKFDHVVSKKMIDVVNATIRWFLRLWDLPNIGELERIMDLIEYAIDGGTVTVGKRVIEYQKGILSGWRWTALYDTIVNAGELLAFRGVILHTTGSNVLEDYVCQGDDVRCKLPSYPAATALWTYYEEAGFIVNPRKFFMDTVTDEFLREVAYRGRVRGYPARAVGSLVWRNPVNPEPAKGALRIKEMYSGWKLLFDRTGVYEWNLARKDISRGNAISVADLEALEITPASVGGVGLFPPVVGVQWKVISVGQENRGWTWSQLPPFAHSLSKRYPVSADGLSKIWLNGVQPAEVTQRKYDPSIVSDVTTVIPIFRAMLKGNIIGIPIQAQADPSLPPSVVAVYQSERWDNPDWLAAESKLYYSRIERVCSRGVLRDWIEGKLPFNAPMVIGFSPSVVAPTHNQVSAYWWGWCLLQGKVNRSLVIRAGVTAELLTREAMLGLDPTRGIVISA